MSRPDAETIQPQQTLRLREAVAIIVGIVIGAGIFKAPSLVAQMSSRRSGSYASHELAQRHRAGYGDFHAG